MPISGECDTGGRASAGLWDHALAENANLCNSTEEHDKAENFQYKDVVAGREIPG